MPLRRFRRKRGDVVNSAPAGDGARTNERLKRRGPRRGQRGEVKGLKQKAPRGLVLQLAKSGRRRTAILDPKAFPDRRRAGARLRRPRFRRRAAVAVSRRAAPGCLCCLSTSPHPIPSARLLS